jgi:glycerophosphoryl diester phosphodiesterase
LAGLPEAADRNKRELLLLSEFLRAYPKVPLNIELKKSFLKKLGNRDGINDNIKEFFKILEEYGGNRTIIITSANGQILETFRKINNEKYHTTLTVAEQFAIKFFNTSYHKPIVETTYANFWTNRLLIDTVHAQDGEIYVFITGFGPIPAIDEDLNEDSAKNKIHEILERGVDGIMTDRPKQVRQIMCRWLKKKLKGLTRGDVTH